MAGMSREIDPSPPTWRRWSHERHSGQEYLCLRKEPALGRGPSKRKALPDLFDPLWSGTLSFTVVHLAPERKVHPEGRPSAGGQVYPQDKARRRFAKSYFYRMIAAFSRDELLDRTRTTGYFTPRVGMAGMVCGGEGDSSRASRPRKPLSGDLGLCSKRDSARRKRRADEVAIVLS
jgi:hypothetical protein